MFNSGYADHGFLGRVSAKLGRGLLTAGWQSDFGRDIERPRNNSRTVRFYYPTEDSHRLTVGYDARELGGFSRLLFTGFVGSYAQVTDQDRFPTSTTARSIERADVDAKDFHLRGSAERSLGTARLEIGVDVNGRYGLRALDISEAYNRDDTLAGRTENVSIDDARRDRYWCLRQHRNRGSCRRCRVAGGLRGDYVATRNSGGFFGDRSTTNGAASGFVALTAGSFGGFSATFQVARGFRDPVLSDRYFRGPSGRGFITGNPELEPESSFQVDLGLRYTASRVRAATYFYDYRIDDLIERYQTETDFFFSQPGPRTFARFRGRDPRRPRLGPLTRVSVPGRRAGARSTTTPISMTSRQKRSRSRYGKASLCAASLLSYVPHGLRGRSSRSNRADRARLYAGRCGCGDDRARRL